MSVAGGLYDGDTGLVRLPMTPVFGPLGLRAGDSIHAIPVGARDYSPVVGRWTNKDPSGFNGKMANLYEYSYNDPINFLDYNGKDPLSFAIAGFFSGGITNAVMTYRNGTHDPSKVFTAFIVGGAGGALAGVGLEAGGIAAVVGSLASFTFDLGSQLLNNTGMFDSLNDYANGIIGAKAGNSQLRQIEKECAQ